MTRVTLNAWMDEHGPLGPHEAALVALACVSRLLEPTGRSGRNVRQIDPAHVERGADGQWAWSPERAARGRTAASERESVVAVGRLLYAVLTGGTTGSQVFVPVDLRKVRPDVPASVAVLVGDAVNGELSLDQLCAGLRAIAGIHATGARLPVSFVWTLGVLLAIGLLVGVVGHGRPASTARVDPKTGLDQELVDGLWDASFGLAWMDEQTAAIEYVQSLTQHESRAFGYDAPRVWWRLAWFAWLSQQRNDYLTAEQYGGMVQEQLSTRLGPGHPYAIAASAMQAATLQQRGAWSAARVQVSTLWQTHVARVNAGAVVGRQAHPSEDDVRQWRLDRDADGDGLGDLAERLLGTDATVAARPLEMLGGRPARAYAVALNPGMVAAHARGITPWEQGFSARPRAGVLTPVYVFASVQRGYAERFGWILQVDANAGGCAVDLDTGTAPRRLRLDVARKDDGWYVTTDGASRRVADPSDALSVVADYDAPSRAIHWWTSAGTTWQTPFDALPPTGEGPYGLWLPGDSVNTCGSVTWLLRHAEVAPL